MANEITTNQRLAVSKGGVAFGKTVSSTTSDMAGDHVVWRTQEIGTSAENLGKGEITTPGWFMAHNLDATNFVEIGYDDTGFKNVVKILAGEWAGPFRLAQAAPQAKADTAAVDLEYIMLEV